jgi:uncharacterized protein (DUF2252 family)
MDVLKSIVSANAGRDPRRLEVKYAKMLSGPFAFLRGSCHLFHERLHLEALPDSPLAWVCGDLHFENFGSYKADNRLVHFDITDFDESALAPVAWDLVRMLASLHTAAQDLSLADGESEHLCGHFVERYAATLASGKARWVERETASGAVADLLAQLHERKRSAFLAKRTTGRGATLALRVDTGKALPTTAAQREQVLLFMAAFARTQADPDFYEVIDVADRIAGTGSLGVERYVILVRGRGGPDAHYLLDLKRAQPSSLVSHLTVRQPLWPDDAVRIATLQQRMQAASMAFLHAVTLEGVPFVLRELQPGEDRVELHRDRDSMDRFRGVIDTMADVVAWAHLRSAGRQGSANADALVDFGEATGWRGTLLAAAREAARQVVTDWSTFRTAMPRTPHRQPDRGTTAS